MRRVVVMLALMGTGCLTPRPLRPQYAPPETVDVRQQFMFDGEIFGVGGGSFGENGIRFNSGLPALFNPGGWQKEKENE